MNLAEIAIGFALLGIATALYSQYNTFQGDTQLRSQLLQNRVDLHAAVRTSAGLPLALWKSLSANGSYVPCVLGVGSAVPPGPDRCHAWHTGASHEFTLTDSQGTILAGGAIYDAKGDLVSGTPSRYDFKGAICFPGMPDFKCPFEVGVSAKIFCPGQAASCPQAHVIRLFYTLRPTTAVQGFPASLEIWSTPPYSPPGGASVLLPVDTPAELIVGAGS